MTPADQAAYDRAELGASLLVWLLCGALVAYGCAA
jgi:hypothetical protein